MPTHHGRDPESPPPATGAEWTRPSPKKPPPGLPSGTGAELPQPSPGQLPAAGVKIEPAATAPGAELGEGSVLLSAQLLAHPPPSNPCPPPR